MNRSVSLLAALFLIGALVAGCGQAPDTADDAVRAVGELIGASDLQGADERLRVALAQWPTDWRLRELQGDIDLRRGNGTRAQAAFERAIRGDPGNRRLQVKLARSLFLQDRLREVLALATPAANDPEDVLAGFRLLRLETNLALGVQDPRASRDEAEALWRLAATGAPGMGEIGPRLGELAAREEAVEAARQHAQCRPPVEPVRSAESDTAPGRLLRVGPGEELRTPGAAAAVAGDGDVIEIEAGSYEEGPVVWSQETLRLRGRHGRPRIRLAGKEAAGGAAWTFRGGITVVENIEFAGAGLRLGGGDLTVRGSIFRGGSAGIIATDDAPDSEILVTGTEFDAEPEAAAGDASAIPAVEAGRIAKLTVEFSYVHGARYGAGVTSRARVTDVNYNRIAGESGPVIDLPAGGTAQIVGNELALGSGSGGAAFIAFGDAAGRGEAAGAALSVVSNTLQSAAPGRVGVRASTGSPVLVANNVFEGAAITPYDGKVMEGGNFAGRDSLANPAAGDFGLVPGSPAIDAAVDPRKLFPAAPLVEFEYLHPVSGVARSDVWTRDAGAHEYCGATAAGEGGDLPLLEPGGAAGR